MLRGQKKNAAPSFTALIATKINVRGFLFGRRELKKSEALSEMPDGLVFKALISLNRVRNLTK